jgi:DNA-directed RNA polymerase specialized sigma24 family protein
MSHQKSGLTNEEIKVLKQKLMLWSKILLEQYKLKAFLPAEDLFQESFLRFAEILSKEKEGIKNKKAYLKIVMLNIARENWRKAKQFPSVTDSEDWLDGIILNESGSVISDNEVKQLNIIHSMLKEEEINLFRLKYVEEKTWAEVQREVGGNSTVNSLKKDAERIRKKVAKISSENDCS